MLLAPAVADLHSRPDFILARQIDCYLDLRERPESVNLERQESSWLGLGRVCQGGMKPGFQIEPFVLVAGVVSLVAQQSADS